MGEYISHLTSLISYLRGFRRASPPGGFASAHQIGNPPVGGWETFGMN